ncbi:ABC-type amino acid transport system permease component [Candidatus Phytoplasma luffae]|uniref:ABC-type amino acid transport system permease component n=1 Tax=Loofah witches'-broom phytoplasma TaxID=35773 RepID=A0A975FJZ0_LOWBP|nr:ABC-type amino acid transport system permease component [Candidatus Phytoplasma luffae]
MNQKIKKILKIISILFFVILFIWSHFWVLGVQSKKNNNLSQNNPLKVGVVGASAPFAFNTNEKLGEDKDELFKSDVLEDGQFINGSDVALSKQIATELERPIKFISYSDVDSVFIDLKSGSIDMIISALNATQERKDNNYYTAIPYCNASLSLLINRNRSKDFEKIFETENKTTENKTIYLDKIKQSDLNPDKKLFLTTIKTGCFVDKLNRLCEKNSNIFGTSEETKIFLRDGAALCGEAVKSEEVAGAILDIPIIQAIYENDKDSFEMYDLKNNDSNEPFSIFIQKENIALKKDLTKTIKKILLTEEDKQEINENEITVSQRVKMSSKYRDCYEKIAKDIHKKHIQHLKDKHKNIISKIWHTLPHYNKSLFITLLVSIDGLILGFLLTLIFIRVQTKLIHKQQNIKPIILFMYQKGSFLINGLINILNGIPISVQAFLMNRFLTEFSKNSNIISSNQKVFIAALIIILLNTAANLTSIMINNIKTLDKGQIEGAYALGMDDKKVFKYIIFEQGLKRTYPFIINQLVINIKESALFALIGLNTLLWQAQKEQNLDFDMWTPLIIITVIYLILVFLTRFWIRLRKK